MAKIKREQGNLGSLPENISMHWFSGILFLALWKANFHFYSSQDYEAGLEDQVPFSVHELKMNVHPPSVAKDCFLKL